MGFLGLQIDDELEEEIRNTGRQRAEVTRAALRAYFGIDRSLNQDQEVLLREIDRLLDAKIGNRSAFNPIKSETFNGVKFAEEKPPGQEAQVVTTGFNPIKSDDSTSDRELLSKAAQRILDYFNLDQEPTAQQIADDLGVESRPLGRIMAAAGLQAQNVRRGGNRIRRYTFDQREKIEDLLKKTRDWSRDESLV